MLPVPVPFRPENQRFPTSIQTRMNMNPLPQNREVKWTDVDGVAVLAEHKGVPVKATIEHLRDGSSYR